MGNVEGDQCRGQKINSEFGVIGCRELSLVTLTAAQKDSVEGFSRKG